MVAIVIADGTCAHTGSACSPPVAGTLTVGSNTFVRINGQLVVVDDGRLLVPNHLPPSCLPPPESHNYPYNSLQQNWVTIGGLSVVLNGDGYTSDPTTVNSPGSNTFVEVTP